MTHSTLGALGTGVLLLIACGSSHMTSHDGDNGTSTDTSSMSADNGSESSPIGEQEPTNSATANETATDTASTDAASANPGSDANTTASGAPDSQEASTELASDSNGDVVQSNGTSVDSASPSETPTAQGGNPSTETQATGNSDQATDDQAQPTDTTTDGEPGSLPVTEDSAAPDDATDPDTANTVPSWTEDILPFFAASCGSDTVACHSKEVFAGQVGSDCRGWLSLDNSPLGSTYLGEYQTGEATGCPDVPLYERLLTTTWQCDDLPYVNPEDPENSYLYRKIAGGPYCPNGDVPSDPMPQVGSLDPAQIEMVRRWIEAGAPYDGP